MIIHNDGDEDSKEFSGGGDNTQDQRREIGDGIKNKDLSKCSQKSEQNQISHDSGVSFNKLNEAQELTTDKSNK